MNASVVLPRRALVLRADIEANTMPALVEALIVLAGEMHELARAGIPPEASVTRRLADREVIAHLRANLSMTPELHRREMAIARARAQISQILSAPEEATK